MTTTTKFVSARYLPQACCRRSFSLHRKVSYRLILSCLCVLSYYVLSFRVLSYRVLSYYVLSCLILSCLILSCRVLSYRVLSCLILSCLIVSSYLIVCQRDAECLPAQRSARGAPRRGAVTRAQLCGSDTARARKHRHVTSREKPKTSTGKQQQHANTTVICSG